MRFRITDPNGNVRSAGEAYDQAQQAKDQAQQAKEDAKSQAFQAGEQGLENRDQARGTAQSLAGTARAHAADVAGSRDPNTPLSQQKEQIKGAASNKADQASSQVDTSDVPNGDEAADEARSKAQQLKDKIPEKHRAMATDTVNFTKDVFNDKFPEERRDQFIYRLKKVSDEST
jgi:hypothetical protein